MGLQLPAFLANRPRPSLGAQAMAGLGGQSPPHVSIKQNRFRLVDAAGNEKLLEVFHLDIVIVDTSPHVSKIYYRDAFDPTATEYKPPTCFSDNGVGPSSQAEEPQFSTCAACPNNVWGSAVSKVSGKGTKACNDVKKIAVLVPEHAPGMGFLLRIPPASLKNFGSCVASIMGQGVEPCDLVVRVTFDANVQGVLNFAPVSFITEEMYTTYETVFTAIGNGEHAFPQLVGTTDIPFAGAIAALTPRPALAAPQTPVREDNRPAGQIGHQAVAAALQPAPEAPKQGRGRPRKEPPPAAVAPPPASPPPQNGGGFFAGGGPAPAAQGFGAPASPTAPPPPAGNGSFGMQPNPPPPPSDVQAALAAAFGLPT